MKFQCLKCGRKLNCRDEKIGKRARCPGCKELITIPGPAPTKTSAKQPQPESAGTSVEEEKNYTRPPSDEYPCGDICWYCMRNRGTPDLEIKVENSKEVGRQAISGGGIAGGAQLQEVSYSSFSTHIPRCQSCAELHNHSIGFGTKMQLLIGSAAFLALVISFAPLIFGTADMDSKVTDSHKSWMLFGFSIFLLSLGWAGYKAIRLERLFKSHGTLSYEMVGEYPEIQKAKRDGFEPTVIIPERTTE